jgi:hypothetical protein
MTRMPMLLMNVQRGQIQRDDLGFAFGQQIVDLLSSAG